MANLREDNLEHALDWAENQNFQSVAARYAKILASEVRRLRGAELTVQKIEADHYPNWFPKFRDLPEAISDHIHRLESRIRALDEINERQREELNNHKCYLPDSIQEALNSGDGVYRP